MTEWFVVKRQKLSDHRKFTTVDRSSVYLLNKLEEFLNPISKRVEDDQPFEFSIPSRAKKHQVYDSQKEHGDESLLKCQFSQSYKHFICDDDHPKVAAIRRALHLAGRIL
uniref:Uncharacterized protein n=1 Tax=Medicago truncatula TaxID=3880 RepID=Q2HT76_MEDTR|nr:hypothetical protein MtrDRAFT_AC150777g5v1 [Medicago truncatula]